MFCSSIEATIFYRHQPQEVRALGAATIPLAEHVRAVADGFERHRIKAICGGQYFREKEALHMRNVLLRAAKHARAHLDDYFPMMRDEIIANAERLEEAVAHYWVNFKTLQSATIPAK